MTTQSEPLETPKQQFVQVQGKKLYTVSGTDEITMFDGTKVKINPEPLETPSELEVTYGIDPASPNGDEMALTIKDGSTLYTYVGDEARVIERLIAEARLDEVEKIRKVKAYSGVIERYFYNRYNELQAQLSNTKGEQSNARN